MELERRRPTTVQRVFEALERLGNASNGEIAVELGISLAAVRQAVFRLKERGLIEWANRAPRYCLAPNAKRPIDGRGRKRE